MKRVLIIFGVVLALIVAAVLVLPSFVDWNNYRDEIAAQIESATGRRVSIDGDVSFSVLPSPALSIGGMRIANLPGASSVDVVSLGSLDIEVALFPLISGTVQVERVVLVDAVIDLEILPDGRRNWVFESTDAEAGDTNAETGGGLDISVDSFLVRNGTILYRSGPGEPLRLDGLDLEISARSLSGPFDISGDVTYSNVPFNLTVDVGQLDADRTPIKVDFKAKAGAVTGSILGAAPLNDGEPAFEGKIDISAQNPRDFLKKLGMSGVDTALYTEPFSLTADAAATGDRVAVDGLQLSLGAIAAKGGLSVAFAEIPEVKLLLDFSSLDLDALMGPETGGAKSEQPVEDEEAFTLPDDIRGTAEITVGSMVYRGGTVRQARLTATLDGGALSVDSLSALLPGGSDMAFTGRLSATAKGMEAAGRLRLGSSSTRGLVDWLGVDVSSVPGDRLSQLSLEATLAATPSLIQLHDMKLVLDTTQITGAFAYALQERPSFSADLTADRINADAYMSSGDSGESLDDTLKVLADFDTKLRLKIGRLTLDKTQINDIAADIGLLSGVLTINQFSAGDFAGATVSMTGTGRGFAGSSQWDLAVEATADRAGGLLNYMGMEPPSQAVAEGPLALSFGLKGTLAASKLAINGAVGTTTLTISGDGTKVLEDDRQFNLRLDVQNPSWAAFARQLDLADLQPLEGQDGSAALKGTIVGAGGNYELNLEALVAGGSISVSGKIMQVGESETYALALNAKGDSLPRFARGLGMTYEPAEQKVSGFDISASVAGTSEKIQFDKLSARLGPSALTGQMTVDRSGARTRVEADLSAEVLDADAYLGPREAGPRLVRQSGGQRWSTEPIGLEFLRDFDGRLAFQAKEFRVRRYNFDEPKMVISLTSGVLRLESLSGFLFGGKVAMSGVLDVSAVPVFTLDIGLQDASVAQALQTSADLQSATGTLMLNAQVAGRGDSELAIVTGLRGRGTLEARDGVIRGFDLPKLSKQMLTLVNYDDFIGLANIAFDGGETPYQLISTPFTITSGMVHIKDGEAQLTDAKGTITAEINLPKWTMDSQLQFRLTDPEHKNTPPAGLRIYGDIDDPKQEKQIRQLSSYIGSRLANRVLQDVMGQGQQGGGGLQQLLGGSQSGQTGQTQEQAPASNPMEQLFRGIMDQVRQERQE